MTVVSQDDKVRAEQVRLLYEAIPASIFATVFIASILVSILWSSGVSRNDLIIWLALSFLFSLLRFIFYNQYKRKKDNDDKLEKYERNFLIGTALSALAWGLVPVALYPENITFQVVVAFALAGMSAGAVTSLSFNLTTIRVFLFVSLIPLIVRFFSSEDYILEAMGVMVMAHLGLLLVSAKRIYVNTEQNIVLRLDSDRREHELERVIAERERLDEMKNDFISTVSHELRTPLTSIRGSLGLLLGGVVCEIPRQAEAMLDIACNNTERLLLLINDILDLQKIESGKLKFKFEAVDLHQFLVDGLRINEGLANEYELVFNLKEGAQNVYVQADSERLLQVLSNLLSNAAKFSPCNGVVDVSYGVIDQHVKIQVADRGVGIPKEFYKDVFGKFTQADTSDTKKTRGAGLGLSISKHIVEKHNGTIGFQSEEGVGTTFYIELPILPVPVVAGK